METEVDCWIEESAEDESEGNFRPGLREIIARLILLALILWVLVSMILPRRNLILQIDLPPRPPAEQIEPNYWL
jgi:hypothetical protein